MKWNIHTQMGRVNVFSQRNRTVISLIRPYKWIVLWYSDSLAFIMPIRQLNSSWGSILFSILLSDLNVSPSADVGHPAVCWSHSRMSLKRMTPPYFSCCGLLTITTSPQTCIESYQSLSQSPSLFKSYICPPELLREVVRPLGPRGLPRGGTPSLLCPWLMSRDWLA